MKQLLNKWLKNSQLFNFCLKMDTLKQFIFKPNCLLCAESTAQNSKNTHPSTHAVCGECLAELPWHPKTSCPQCGLASSGAGLNAIVCGSCLNSPPDFDATKAVFLYAYPIDAMMLRYKYGSMLNLGDTFGEFLAEKINIEDCLRNIDLIVPMPMHPQRLQERGFNQALEIAKILTKNCKEKLDYKSTERQTLTPPQASLPLKERVKNIKGAFKVNTALKEKRIAIIDDVMTTGASLNELAKTLKKAGASHVECWVVARTLPHQ
ncbi:MAG: ComF family protein [Bdellovibrio sp.]|nr:ComF family protein [Methylotenera sp.]